MPELLKNGFNEEFLTKLCLAVKKEYEPFDESEFMFMIEAQDFWNKELKQRAREITHALAHQLPDKYEGALWIIRKTAPQFPGLTGMIFPDFVSYRGLDYFDLSVSALKELTEYFSSEFAIRPFIKKYPVRMFAILTQWATDENHHVRRLASEGCRPRLPWAEALEDLKKDPSPILPILEILKEDDSDYVRKSVANNLNDISKDHPRLVLDLAKQWIGKNEKTDWIIRHGCRTLLKKGDAEALRLFGFNPTKASIQEVTISSSTIVMGGELQAAFKLVNPEEAKLRIEYIMEFAKANQKVSRKIFKLSEKVYTKGTHSLTIKHSFKDLSTRKHYPGEHRLFIIVNGEEKEYIEFILKDVE